LINSKKYVIIREITYIKNEVNKFEYSEVNNVTSNEIFFANMGSCFCYEFQFYNRNIFLAYLELGGSFHYGYNLKFVFSIPYVLNFVPYK